MLLQPKASSKAHSSSNNEFMSIIGNNQTHLEDTQYVDSLQFIIIYSFKNSLNKL